MTSCGFHPHSQKSSTARIVSGRTDIIAHGLLKCILTMINIVRGQKEGEPMADLITRQAAIDILDRNCILGQGLLNDTLDHIADAIMALPSAQPTEASCWGCNCQKMERLKEQKTFSEMVHLHDAETHEERTETHLHDAETHEERTETHTCDLISRQAAIDAILAVTGNSSVRELYEHVQEHGLSDMWSGGVNAAIDIIIAVPSAQPEQTNSWCINSWCNNCKEYDKEKHSCPRFNRVIKQTLDEVYAHAETEAEARFHAEIVRCKDCMYWVAHDKRCVYLNHGFAPNMWCCHGRRADG